ncbi:helix-turn-helix domain-containing protein [Herbaspirillum sp. RTI4]|uniref:helix-turn-helix domain-containing protein n=1 Tax=Herbaspirillum sp. RTI4 TaxID=3048640 RepID=UPI002AB3BE91|nr:helix-turn-helix domain-containing protein [Herbaspirillum sp. RTI4]MDY7577272.1 helix-turn-helix domain-containing protein [Herbaspirillum sp. RTI4]MEA9983536.1 helix-turn-helix domain-containing protein [Herbaspirillum sp. RTI4]
MAEQQSTVLRLDKGATVTSNGRDYVIVAVADLNLLLAREVGSGEKVLLKITDLSTKKFSKVIAKTSKNDSTDLLETSSEDWLIAEKHREIIDPLLEPQDRASVLYAKIAEESGVSRATLYRWVQAFRNTGLLSSLLPTKRDGGRGRGRLSDEVEAIIKDCIENYHLTDQQRSVSATAEEVRRLCSNANFPLPDASTVRRRILWITERELLSRRKGTRAAEQRFDPNISSIPDAEWPLAMVQIDHTLLPVMIVDDISRLSIGRAWITLAIDVSSRMNLGMCLTLDPPSAMSAGMCVSHAIIGKEKWLAELAEDVEWPCWGVMGTLHMDNAREFRGDMLKVACAEYDIDLHLRPVKKPRYGAHIERLMGTVSEALKTLDGATFSGPKEKGEYDSEVRAFLTLAELEKWLVLFFGRYHRRIHAGIGTTPLQKWREGLLGGNGRPARGLPARRLDEEKIRLDFMPFEERTVQDYGIVIDDVHYFHDVLRPWINVPDPHFPRHRRKFRFKRDLRDISHVYFFDPEVKRYCAIPYRDLSLPPVSIWELRDAKARARELGIPTDHEKEVFALINRQRELESDAAHKTKVARRNVQKRAEHEKARKKNAADLPTVSTPGPSGPPSAVRGYDPSKVKPLEDEY